MTPTPRFSKTELADLAAALESYGNEVGSDDASRIDKLKLKIQYLRTGKLPVKVRPGAKVKTRTIARSNPYSTPARIKKARK